MNEYKPKDVEAKWQDHWVRNRVFSAGVKSIRSGLAGDKYILDMFPYPSGDGLHVGHAKIYTGSDVASRYWRMKGFAVLHPMGWDAFGLPTENTAIKNKEKPQDLTKRNIDRFRSQMQAMGFSYDWDREVDTTDPDYYKWTQWIFLQLLKMNLAYEAIVDINWCPQDKTGLANEEVVDEKCDRCGAVVERKPMRQWMLRITKYADRLLKDLDKLDWPNSILELQKNWIGKSEGAEIQFKTQDIKTSEKFDISVFTTRPDTLFGATYLVLAPEHELVDRLTVDEARDEVMAYVDAARHMTEVDRSAEGREKTGVFTGAYATNPATGEQIPIWVADYVLGGYGTGAIMAVPAHDQRDWEFAKKFGLEIRQVIASVEKQMADLSQGAFTDDGVLVNSQQFDGEYSEKARRAIVGFLSARGLGKKKIQFKLRDWVFSRQRYWGEPIPVIHCEECGIVPVPEDELPVVLPDVASYEPTGTGDSPLAAIEEWVNVKCPTCPRMGKRETNTMPQWAGSSWYWLRFTDPQNSNFFASRDALRKWMPVDLYVGGAEHAVLHLLYARFWQKALHDAGHVTNDEPFLELKTVGLLMGEDGVKMSKSRGNVVTPDEVIGRVGADTLRTYVMFMGPFSQSVPWNTDSLMGAKRFLERVWRFYTSSSSSLSEEGNQPGLNLKVQQTIQRVSEGIERFSFNVSIAALMELLNEFESKPEAVTSEMREIFIKLLSPIAPHLCAELWEMMGRHEELAFESWPEADDRVLQSAQITLPIMVNGKVRGTLEVSPGSVQALLEARAREIPNVAKFLHGVQIVKIVFVQDKMLNFVVKPA